MLLDARELTDASILDFDVVVVGAGPAGIALADGLAQRLDAGRRIALIVGGGFEMHHRYQALLKADMTGLATWPLERSRFRIFGGAAHHWGGICRPFDSLDFEARSWVPRSGWPISAEDIAPYYEQAARLLMLSSPRFDYAEWADRMPQPLSTEESDFENAVVQISPTEMSFGQKFAARILGHHQLTTIIHGSVTEIHMNGAVAESVTLQTLGDSRSQVRGRYIVLAAGGIENPRLLLASRGDRPAGVGNEHDQVGRYFMEHLHASAGYLRLNPATSPASRFYATDTYGSDTLRGALVPTAAAQREHELLNAWISVEPLARTAGQPFLKWPSTLAVPADRLYRALGARTADAEPDDVPQLRVAETSSASGSGLSIAGVLRGAVSTISRAPTAWQVAATERRLRAGLPAGSSVHSLYFRSEQVPSPESRVRLSSTLDRFGNPTADLHWKLSAQDTASVDGWLDRLQQMVRDSGAGDVLSPENDWTQHVIGGPHHMGTTRMSVDPRHGVVDADCRVHSATNLYVAGASVFATGGYANPTFSLVALSLRLVDHLVARFAATSTDSFPVEEVQPAIDPAAESAEPDDTLDDTPDDNPDDNPTDEPPGAVAG